MPSLKNFLKTFHFDADSIQFSLFNLPISLYIYTYKTYLVYFIIKNVPKSYL